MSPRPHVGFYALLVVRQPRVICEIGALDGEQSLRFKRLCPRSAVVAFEANPVNYLRMCANRALSRSTVVLENKAVTDQTGPVTFNVVDVPVSAPWARGSSSLLQRGLVAAELRSHPVTVDGIRLDDYLATTTGGIALWVDVEGAAQQVLHGAEGILDRVAFMHIEAETEQIWVGRATAVAVLAQLKERGFEEMGRMHEDTAGVRPEDSRQHNYLMVRPSWPARFALSVAGVADGIRRQGRRGVSSPGCCGRRRG
jgi:FkbM family methyltransferase